MADIPLGILCFSLWGKKHVLSLCMPPFTGSDYIGKRGLSNIVYDNEDPAFYNLQK